MKIKGHSFEAPNREICVLPRGNGQPDLVFIAEAVLDWDEFDLVCPPPKVPMVKKPGGVTEYDHNNKTYIANVAKRNELRMAWLFLKSISVTPDLEWETVDMKNPKTWLNYQKEMKDAFLSTAEISRVMNAVLEANSISEARVQEARENFVRGQQDNKDTSSGPSTEQDNTPSGDPVNDSE